MRSIKRTFFHAEYNAAINFYCILIIINTLNRVFWDIFILNMIVKLLVKNLRFILVKADS